MSSVSWCYVLILVVFVWAVVGEVCTPVPVKESLLNAINTRRTLLEQDTLVWSEQLACKSKSLASICELQHTSLQLHSIFVQKGPQINDVTSLLDFDSVFWASISSIGCAVSTCGDEQMLICSSDKRDHSKRTTECYFGSEGYMGCFADSYTTHDLSHGPYSLDTVSPQACACLCGQLTYQYAALQNLDECYCGNSYGSLGSSTSCTLNCPDDSSSLCGGFGVNSVYKTNIGCHGSCTNTQTCVNYGNFYWCAPDCDFSVTTSSPPACSNTGNISITVSGGSTHNNQFFASVDGAAKVAHTMNNTFTENYAAGSTHTFTISNLFNCSQQVSVSVPVTNQPDKMSPPMIVFDVAQMQMNIMWFTLLYPSETGQLQPTQYTLQYRKYCANSTPSNWTTLSVASNTDLVTATFEYNLFYDARVTATNCYGVGTYSEIGTFQAPASSYIPTVLKIPSDISTQGGLLTITGSNFGTSPKIQIDTSMYGNLASASSTQIVVSIPAGYGKHLASVQTTENYPCQVLSSVTQNWNYAKPSITSTSTLSNLGGNLTISGNNFGPIGTPIMVTIDDSICNNCAVSSAHNAIQCGGCPRGTGDSHTIKVDVGGQTTSQSFTYAMCSPICIYGDCVATNICQCHPNYSGIDCSEVAFCMSSVDAPINQCGSCSTGVCCNLHD